MGECKIEAACEKKEDQERRLSKYERRQRIQKVGGWSEKKMREHVHGERLSRRRVWE